MGTTTAIASSRFSRFSTLCVLVALMLVLLGGAVIGAPRVGAAAPQGVQVNAQTGAGGLLADSGDGVATKPKGGGGNRGKNPNKTAQPEVKCVHYTQDLTVDVFGFDPGPTGYWDCYFV